jgi:hypothetical protein
MRLRATRLGAIALAARRGGGLGPELTVNGGFDSGLTGWTQNAAATGTAIVIGGVLTYTSPHGDYAETKQLNITTIGRTYRVSYEIVSKVNSSTAVTIQVGRANVFNNSILNLPLGVQTATVVSTHPDGFAISVRTDGVVAIDNISVREVL